MGSLMVMGCRTDVRSTLGFDLALFRTSRSSIMPKDPTEKKEKKEKREKREKKKKEKDVAQDAPTEALTTDVPEDVEMDIAQDAKVGFSRPACVWFQPIGHQHHR